MIYQVKKINEKEQIETCEQFAVAHYKWNSKQEPKTYGWLGYIEEKGLYVKMVCEEKNPKREYKNHRDRVCEDSAMEIFFAFADDGDVLTTESMYVNFEINANGAKYIKYGKGRKNRSFITEEQCEMIECEAEVTDDNWSLKVLVPEKFLNEIYDFERLKEGETFYCNFYKISESKEIEHYGSYSPVDSETPNFHLLSSFAEVRIV